MGGGLLPMNRRTRSTLPASHGSTHAECVNYVALSDGCGVCRRLSKVVDGCGTACCHGKKR